MSALTEASDREMDLLIAELDYENRLLRARNERQQEEIIRLQAIVDKYENGILNHFAEDKV